MNRTESSAGAAAGQFRTTNWNVVLLSTQSQAPGAQSALADLCQLYWYPLYAFIRGRGYNATDAEDLTQGFFLSLLERKSLRKVRPDKGKFRSFLLASLKNYLVDTFDRANSVKRGGGIEFVGIDLESGEERYLGDATNTLNAETTFDARWAMALLTHVMDRLRAEYVSAGRAEVFGTLQPFLDPKSSQDLPSYDEVASRLQATLGGAKTLIHRFRKRHSEILREEVSRTVIEPEAVDQEIHALCEALIASDAHLE